MSDVHVIDAAPMCLVCLDTVAKESKQCPLCRKALAEGSGLRDVRSERAAANTERECPHEGCDFCGKRDALRQHIASCSKRPVEAVLSDYRSQIALLTEGVA